MRLRPKFGILLFVVFSVLAMVISILEANWINLLVIDHTAQQMKQNIKTGWQILHDRIAQLERSIEFLSEKNELQQGDALSPASVEPLLTRYESQWQLDVLQIATPETLLSAGIHLDYTSRAAGNPIQSGFAIVSESAFGFAPVPPIENNHTMILYAAVLLPAAPEPGAVLFCAVNLKGAFTLVDTIQAAIFEDLYYQGKRVGTVTIFMGVERIATTVLKQTGERAVGTLVSDEVAEQTLKQGVPWTGRAWVVNNWYLSQYDPIRDAKGKVIGMLYIGELEQVYLDMKWNTLWKSVLVVFIVMALAMLVSYKVSARVLQQIEALDQATLRFA
ncbi:MAG: cache domain-containing protein, partial [bacterium]|nr:cache domain-containing protein [bacterium]